MASLNMAFGVAATRGRLLFAAKAAKSSASVEEEKGLFDWIVGGLRKDDQLLETDPVLQKVEDKSSGRKPTNSVAIPNKKKTGGFGSLFVKN